MRKKRDLRCLPSIPCYKRQSKPWSGTTSLRQSRRATVRWHSAGVALNCPIGSRAYSLATPSSTHTAVTTSVRCRSSMRYYRSTAMRLNQTPFWMPAPTCSSAL